MPYLIFTLLLQISDTLTPPSRSPIQRDPKGNLNPPDFHYLTVRHCFATCAVPFLCEPHGPFSSLYVTLFAVTVFGANL